ncbi:PIN domain-like protein, partial [Mycena maculata]
LKPAVEYTSVINLATVEGFQRNSSGTRSLLLGVDISILLESCAATLRTAGLRLPWAEIPALKIFFYQLCQFSKAPITLIFVFDGPLRPTFKRGKQVIHCPTSLTEHVKNLIVHFGYYYHEAPAEAEAELAKLNALGYLYGILTDDSDALVFGAQRVIRTTGSPTVNDVCHMYTADQIENTAGVGLSTDGLLLFAVLSGGDYNTGLARCGPVIAHSLALGGFGKRLVEALTSLGEVTLRRALNGWHEDLRAQLRTNSAGLLPCRYGSLAASVPDTFPNVAHARRYLNPLTSWLPEYSGLEPDTNWLPREPHIRDITAFCVDRFGWTDSGDFSSGLLKRFRRNLWAGVAHRMLSSVGPSFLN